MTDGYEPHGSITQPDMPVRQCTQPGMTARWGRGVPGVGYGWVGTGEGYTGYYPVPAPGPIFNLFLRLRPYPRPYEGNSQCSDEVPQIWSRIDLRIDPDMDPE